MSRLTRLLPATLLGRALLTLVLTFGLFAAANLAAFVVFALTPLAERSAADLATLMALSARALPQVPPELQADYLANLERDHQIRLRRERPADMADDDLYPYRHLVAHALAERVGHPIAMLASTVDGERWYWAELAAGEGTLWIGFPRGRLGARPLMGLSVVIGVAILLILATTVILAGRLAVPLRRLSQAAEQVALGFSPKALPETGPLELANLARQLNETSRQIRELLANRTMLLAGISHDLRAPLARLRLAVAMLPNGAASELTLRMERDIDEMNELITQAIEFGRSLGAGRREDIEVGALIDDLVAGRPRILWQRGQPCPCRVDVIALRRILGNLLENALGYSQDRVEVRLDCDSPRLTIQVLDRGPGIPEAVREAVVRPYFRLEVPHNRQGGGSGLGLAVAYQLALANQIDLQLGARRGGGTIASVRLPAAATPEPDQALAATS